MKVFSRILKRELLAYLRSPMAYVLGAFFLFLLGYLFTVTLDFERRADLSTLFRDLGLFLLFLAPLLTMRLLAEDRRTGMLDVLLAEPVSPRSLVLAKYGAAMVFLGLLLLPTLVFPAFLFAYGHPDPGPIVTAYLGVGLLSAAYLAVGLFASSISRSQLTAAMITFAILVFFWIIGWGVSTFGVHADENGPSLQKAFEPLRVFAMHSPENLSLYSHFDGFVQGVVDSRGVVFFLSTALLFLFLASRLLTLDSWPLPLDPTLISGDGVPSTQKRRGLLLTLLGPFPALRRSLLRRRRALALQALAMALVGCLVWGFVNHLSFRHRLRWDATADGRRSLRVETLELLSSVQAPLEVTSYFKTGSMFEQVEELLRAFRQACPWIRVKHIDPERDAARKQAFLKTHRLDDLRMNSLILSYRSRLRQIASDDLTEANRRRRIDTGWAGPLFGAERALSGAITSLLRPQRRRIVFLTGHGERSFDARAESLGAWVAELRRENYMLGQCNLATATKLPDGCDLVVAAGPHLPYPPAGLALLEAHLEKGGALLVLLDGVPSLPGLESLLEAHGLIAGPGPIEDPEGRLARGPATAFVTKRWGDHPVTQGLREQQALVLGSRIAHGPSGRDLLFSSASSRLMDSTAGAPVTSSARGPLPLAALVEGRGPNPGSTPPPAAHGAQAFPWRVALLGDVDLASNRLYEAGANRLFLLNLVHHLALCDDAPSYPPRRLEFRNLLLTKTQRQRLLWTCIAVLPLSVLALGFLAWSFRRV